MEFKNVGFVRKGEKRRPGEKRTRKENQQPTSYSVHQPQDLNTGHLGAGECSHHSSTQASTNQLSNNWALDDTIDALYTYKQFVLLKWL